MNDSPGKPTAVVLLSGGLDSATTAAWALARGERLAALSIDYGQRHRVEIEAAREVAAGLGIADHIIMPINLAGFGGSALVDDTQAVPKGRSDAAIASGIPSTYVPARNTVFLSLALALAESRGASRLVLGVNAVDYSGYPDCRPEFLEAFRQLANLATKAGVEGGQFEILAPLVALTKAEIIRTGLDLGVDYALTTSCYDPGPNGRPCGTCDSCQIRAAGFASVGVPDPRLARFPPEAEDQRRADR
ncbi:MAG: 7-cyano-7-deazaguanine synthase QueC [Pirellulales bacterium]|jgi:7-cyano-7-deazaguanine synthase